MTEGYWILLIVTMLGLLSKNDLITGSSLILLLLKIGGMHSTLDWLNRHGVPLGLFILVLALLVPVAAEQISLRHFIRELFSLPGFIAIIASALGTYFAGHGVQMMEETPSILVGLVIGSVAGVVVLGGVPSGPLIAAGTTALLLRILRH